MMRNLIYNLPCCITNDEKSGMQLAMLHYKWWEIWHATCHAAVQMMRNLAYSLPCCSTNDEKSDIQLAMLHYKWWEIWYTTCHAALQMMRNLIYLPCGITHDEKSDIQLAMLHYKWWEIWHTICHAALHMMGNLTYCHAALHMMRNLTYNLPCCITHDGKSDIPPTEQIPTPSGRTWLRSATFILHNIDIDIAHISCCSCPFLSGISRQYRWYIYPWHYPVLDETYH